MSEAPFGPLLGNRYRLIRRIGIGGMGVVYQAADRLMSCDVALKRLHIGPGLSGANLDSSQIRLLLAREFQTLASLRHPNIISVLDYGFDDERQPYFTMSLLEKPLQIVEAARLQTIEGQVDLLLQVLQALTYLHRHHIVHRDLKPGNILVDPGGQVKVLDFGLAVPVNQARGAAGTIAYMAPELLREQGAATEASDLYSFGVIAYEIFAGQHPFGTGYSTGVINAILHETPDVLSLPIDVDLQTLLLRLLEKDHAQRLVDTDEVTQQLSHAIGRPVPGESEAIRESFLQAATFVGRREQLDCLSQALDRITTPEPAGSLWLIGGESGVGKSRLVNELRIQALGQGVMVVKGQAVDEGAVPFQVWHDVLRWLTLQVNLSDLEASVLKLLVPDIERLVGRDVADAPEIAPQAAQNRLFTVIERLFSRQKEPLLILLEDLHWGKAGLRLLKRISPLLSGLPVLIAATYRSDERPDIPNILPGACAIQLPRLDRGEIAELSQSMLGETGRQQEVLNLLEQETEGNVFFIVEVVRALVEEAGRLNRVGQMMLPSNVAAGGMEMIIQRRLAYVPERAVPLLNLAAIAGRRINRFVLQAAVPDVDMDDWLQQCASVITVLDGDWQFAHDKLRQAVLHRLSPGAVRAGHRQVALAIEALTTDPFEQVDALAHHWANAGVLSKEAHYAALAGQHALRRSAYLDAIRYFERALEISSDCDGLERAQLLKYLSDAHIGSGNLQESLSYGREALAFVGIHMPAPGDKLAYHLLKHLVGQFMNRLLPGSIRRRMLAAAELVQFISGLQLNAAIRYGAFLNEVMVGFVHVLAAMNRLERTRQPTALLVESYGITAVAVQSLGYNRLAALYGNLAQRALINLENPDQDELAAALQIVSYYLTFAGNWDEAVASGRQAGRISLQIGNERTWRENCANLGLLYRLQGRFAEAIEVAGALRRAAVQGGDVQAQAWALAGLSEMLLRIGEIEKARQIVDERDKLLPELMRQKTSPVASYKALVYSRLGDLEAARHHLTGAVEEMHRIVRRATPHDYYTIFNTLETCFELWYETGESELQSVADEIMPFGRKYANRFGVGRPRLWLFEGAYASLTNQPDKALRHWEQAIDLAQSMAMPYDEAFATFWYGRCLPPDAPKRNLLLSRALALFDTLNAAWDANRVRRLLLLPQE